MRSEPVSIFGRGLALIFGWLLFAAATPVEVQVTGPVYYGSVSQAEAVGVVDIRAIYSENPAFIRMRSFGLSETDGGRGQRLFDEAQAAARHALAVVASANGLDVITEVGGVSGAPEDPVDHTQSVIAELPAFYIEGKVLQGLARGARTIAELDSQALLGAIPEYMEWLGTDPSEARYHILQKDYQDAFARALRVVARDEGVDAVVEKGAATSRLGEVYDVTQLAIDSLGD